MRRMSEGSSGWGSTLVPTRASGWLALGLSVVGLGSWVVLPIVTTLLRDEYPITDSYVMPLIGVVLTVLAAVVNTMVVWLARQRSVANLVATFVTVLAAAFFGLFLAGEALGAG